MTHIATDAPRHGSAALPRLFGAALLLILALGMAQALQQETAAVTGDIWHGNSASLSRIAEAPATVPAR